MANLGYQVDTLGKREPQLTPGATEDCIVGMSVIVLTGFVCM